MKPIIFIIISCLAMTVFAVALRRQYPAGDPDANDDLISVVCIVWCLGVLCVVGMVLP